MDNKTTLAPPLGENERRFRTQFVLLSLGYLVLGAARFLVKDANSLLMGYILGGFALVVGLVRVVSYFAKEARQRIYGNDLTFGIVFLVAGIYTLLEVETVAAVLPVLMGFCVIFDSIVKLQYAFGLRWAGFRFWWVVLGLSLVTAVLGVLLVLGHFPAAVLSIFLGVTLLLDGAVNLATLGLLLWTLRRKEKTDAKEGAAQEA